MAHPQVQSLARSRLFSLWLVPMLALSLLVACDDDNDGDIDTPDAEDREQVEREAQERINDLEAEAGELRDRLAEESGDEREVLEEQLSEVEGQLADGRDRLGELLGADDESFDDARAQFDDFADGLSSRLDDLRNDLFD